MILNDYLKQFRKMIDELFKLLKISNKKFVKIGDFVI